jgi:IclR family pca regulon transcriptional regulator
MALQRGHDEGDVNKAGRSMPKTRSQPRSRKESYAGSRARPGAATLAAAVLDHAPPDADERDYVTSLARGLSVLLAFSDKRRHLSIAQVSHRTGVPRAAARRSLLTLARLGYVAADDARRFFLRPKVLAFGHAYLSGTPLAVFAQPVLDRLSEAVEQSCSLGILDGEEIVYVARSTSSRIMSVTLNVGGRLPAYCTSIGQVLLAHLPESELQAYMRRVKLYAYTERTVASPEKLQQVLKAARQNGYAIADQQMETRICSISVPVRDTSRSVVAGINVIVQGGRVPVREMATRFLLPLQNAAGELGMLLLP